MSSDVVGTGAPGLEARVQQDRRMMRRALAEAEKAAQAAEVPVGAVLALDDRIVAVGRNCREARCDPTGHAEMMAITEGSRMLGRWRLTGTTLYVTLEPCAMCAGALVLARISRLVYGTRDPKAGAVRSLYHICDDPRLNHRMAVEGGVEASRCAALLRSFFSARRRAPSPS